MNVTVVLLDGSQFEVENIKKDTLGKEIFENACNKNGLTDETDYFGLRFINKQDGEFQWIDNERPVKAQLGKDGKDSNITHYLNFAVKFYPVNPTNIKQDLTRYQFVLQLRESLLNGRLVCTMPIYSLLGSFVVQAEFGDYDSGECGENYLDDFEFCPNQDAELIAKVKDYHKRHKGMNPEQAELNFLDNVRKLPMYGVHRHLALDVNNEKVFIGVSNVGVTVYRGNRLMSTFVWPKILSIGFKNKKFYVKIKPADEVVSMIVDEGHCLLHVIEDDDFCKTSVGFKLSNRVAAKRLWKICVEHHTFFRLENVEMAEKKGFLSRFGSPFRYRGKTENEITKEEPHPDKPFNRVSSKRFSERVLKGNRKEPEDNGEKTNEQPPSKDEEEVDSEARVNAEGVIAKPTVVEQVESAPEIPETVPEIKVVEASPKLKAKTEKDEESKEGKDEKKPEESEKDKNGEPEKETEDEAAKEETQIIISNPLAEADIKSSHSVTTTRYTTQTSTDDGNVTSSSTVISSTQVTTQETKNETVTTTTKTLLETAQGDEVDVVGLV